MKEIGAIFVVSISGICTVQLAASKRRYRTIISQFFLGLLQAEETVSNYLFKCTPQIQ